MTPVEQIKKTYDLPGRKWERGHMRGARGKGVHKMRPCAFDEMLAEAVALRAQIDVNDARRAQEARK